MMIEGSQLEVHHTRNRLVMGVWSFWCEECEFQANYTPNHSRFEIVECGNPFARHVCHHKLTEEASVRQLINQLDMLVDEMEIEF